MRTSKWLTVSSLVSVIFVTSLICPNTSVEQFILHPGLLLSGEGKIIIVLFLIYNFTLRYRETEIYLDE